MSSIGAGRASSSAIAVPTSPRHSPSETDKSSKMKVDSLGHDDSSNSSASGMNSIGAEDANSNQGEEINIFQALLLQQDDILDTMLDTKGKDYIVHLKSVDSLGRTPLHLACSRGDLKSVNKILNTAAANVETPDKNNWSPLCVASYYGYKDIVSRLLEESADVDVRESCFDWTPLLAACWGGHVDVYEMLVDQGASIRVKDKNGRSGLFLAAQRNHLALIDAILKRDALHVNEVDSYGRTALYISVQLRHKEAVAKLCAAKANPEIGDQDGRKPLFMAYKLGYEEIAENLINAGADTESTEVDISEGSGEAVRPCKGKFIGLADIPIGLKVTALCEAGERVWGGFSDGSIIVWDLFSRRRLLFYPKAQTKTIHHMVPIDANTVWCLSGNQEIYIWNWNAPVLSSIEPTNIITNSLKLTQGQGVDINTIVKVGNEIYGGSSTSTLFIWNTLIPGTCRKVLLDTSAVKMHDYEAYINGLLFHNGRIYVSVYKYIFCYDPSNKFVFKGHFDGHNDLVTSMVVVDKYLWSSSRDNTIRVWNLETRDCAKVFSEAGGGQVTCLCRTKDDQILSAGRDGLVRSWDTKSLIWKRTFGQKHEKVHITALHWDSNSRLWVSSLDKTVSVWK